MHVTNGCDSRAEMNSESRQYDHGRGSEPGQNRYSSMGRRDSESRQYDHRRDSEPGQNRYNGTGRRDSELSHEYCDWDQDDDGDDAYDIGERETHLYVLAVASGYRLAFLLDFEREEREYIRMIHTYIHTHIHTYIHTCTFA